MQRSLTFGPMGLALLLLVVISVVQALPATTVNESKWMLDNLEAEKQTQLYKQAYQLVTLQFASWRNAENCSAFVDSFTDDFVYCDATDGCLTNKTELLDECNRMGKLAAGNTSDLQLKPMWLPYPDYTKIVATGYQNVLPDGGVCFEFAIAQNFVQYSDTELKSTSWMGYYTIQPGGCSY